MVYDAANRHGGNIVASRHRLIRNRVPGCLIFDEMAVVTSASVRVTASGCEVLNTIPAQLYEN